MLPAMGWRPDSYRPRRGSQDPAAPLLRSRSGSVLRAPGDLRPPIRCRRRGCLRPRTNVHPGHRPGAFRRIVRRRLASFSGRIDSPMGCGVGETCRIGSPSFHAKAAAIRPTPSLSRLRAVVHPRLDLAAYSSKHEEVGRSFGRPAVRAALTRNCRMPDPSGSGERRTPGRGGASSERYVERSRQESGSTAGTSSQEEV